MANEKTPLLSKPVEKSDNEVIVKMPAEYEYDMNNNLITTSLTYEELLPFIIDPGWIRLRRVCFTACWIIFFVILSAACISTNSSMSRVSCGVSMTVTRNDNAGLEQHSVASLVDPQGILSIVMNSINGTVTT